MAAPVIDSFQLDSVDCGTVTLSGHVTADDPLSTYIDFEGAIWDSTSADANGDFFYTGPAYELGMITVVASDQSSSAPVSIELAVAPPTLDSLAVSYGEGKAVTLSGQVTASETECLGIFTYGAASTGGDVASDGSFSMEVSGEYVSLGTVEVYVYDQWGQEAVGTVEISNPAPSIGPLSVTYGTGTEVTISGSVSDDDPATVGIYVSGATYGEAVPDANGNFTVHVADGQSFAGVATVFAEDQWYQYTSTDLSIGPDAPTFQALQVTYGEGTAVTISGVVNGQDPAGLNVDLFGAVYGSATTDSQGNFSLTVPDGDAELGDVYLGVWDAWSNPAWSTVTIQSQPPSLANMQINVSGTRLLSVIGDVVDESPGGLTVNITFMNDPYSVTADAAGHFTWFRPLNSWEEGFLDIVATDDWGLESTMLRDYVGDGFAGA